MEKIASFTIDHKKLLRGIYVSRKDKVNEETVTTFDIRMTEPNRQPVIDVPALHTIEHISATFLRNHVRKDEIIYWGPMGCRTGNYLIMKGDLSSKDILDLMIEMFEFVATFDNEIPGAHPRDCGNYLSMDLPMAKWEAKRYLDDVLKVIEEKNMVYPE